MAALVGRAGVGLKEGSLGFSLFFWKRNGAAELFWEWSGPRNRVVAGVVGALAYSLVVNLRDAASQQEVCSSMAVNQMQRGLLLISLSEAVIARHPHVLKS